jgi:hypothetical protein
MTKQTRLLVLLTTFVWFTACDDDDGDGAPPPADAARETGAPDVAPDTRPDVPGVDAADAGAGDARPDAADAAADAGADAADAAVDAAGDAGDGGTAPSFAQLYTTIISTKCAPCHTTPGGIGITNGKLDMTTQAAAYTNLVNVAAAGTPCVGMGTRVIPGMGPQSLLYLKVSTDDPVPCGSKMPLGGALTAPEAELIEEWIDSGAPNN